MNRSDYDAYVESFKRDARRRCRWRNFWYGVAAGCAALFVTGVIRGCSNLGEREAQATATRGEMARAFAKRVGLENLVCTDGVVMCSGVLGGNPASFKCYETKGCYWVVREW